MAAWGLALRALVRAAGLAWVLMPVLGMPGTAFAFGGLQGANMTRASVLLADHPRGDASVAVEVQFDGAQPGQPIVWLIPVLDTVEVGWSSSTAFRRLDAATAPQYWREVTHRSATGMPCATDGGTVATGMDIDPTLHDELAVGRVRPVETDSVRSTRQVILTPTPDEADPRGALRAQAAAAGYPSSDWSLADLVPYLARGYGMLVIEFIPTTTAGRLQPLLLRHSSDSLELPLLTAAAAAVSGPSSEATSMNVTSPIELQLWVVGPTQAVTLNLPAAVLADARLNWLSARPFGERMLPDGGGGPTEDGGYRPINYEATALAASREGGGVAAITEIAGPSSQHRDRVWWDLDGDLWRSVADDSYEDGVDAVAAALSTLPGWDGMAGAVARHVVLPDNVDLAAFVDDPQSYRGQAVVDVDAFLDATTREVVAPVEATGALLNEGPYLTRLYARFDRAALGADPVVGYNYDLAQVDNVHIARQTSTCPDAASTSNDFQVRTPQGAVVVGATVEPSPARPSWPGDREGMPASLAIVELGLTGAGRVLADNRAQVTAALEALGGRVERPTVQSPKDGAIIGGVDVLQGPAPVPTPRREGPAVAVPLDTTPATVAAPVAPPTTGSSAPALPANGSVPSTTPARGDPGCALGGSGSGDLTWAAASLLCVALRLRRRRLRGTDG